MYSVGIRIFRQCFYERRTGMMKRVIAVFLLLIMLLGMVSMFTACGRIGEREECHQREKPDEVQIRGRRCRMAL